MHCLYVVFRYKSRTLAIFEIQLNQSFFLFSIEYFAISLC